MRSKINEYLTAKKVVNQVTGSNGDFVDVTFS